VVVVPVENPRQRQEQHRGEGGEGARRVFHEAHPQTLCVGPEVAIAAVGEGVAYASTTVVSVAPIRIHAASWNGLPPSCAARRRVARNVPLMSFLRVFSLNHIRAR
jgi:hypothetical protein